MADEAHGVREGEGYAVANLDGLVLPAGYETGRHYHEEQEELYFVHEGQVQITLGDETVHELGPGGLARVDAATVRRIKNVGGEPAVLLVVGGKDGYVGRDGKLPEGETSRFGSGGPPGA